MQEGRKFVHRWIQGRHPLYLDRDEARIMQEEEGGGGGFRFERADANRFARYFAVSLRFTCIERRVFSRLLFLTISSPSVDVCKMQVHE